MEHTDAIKMQSPDFIAEFVAEVPDHLSIKPGVIVIVGGVDWAKWVLMKCPCGCGEVLTLSLMKSFRPRWKLKVSKKNRITLSPSVWKKDGCRSHFYIRKSKLRWVIFDW
jgi:hypothetical protein